MSSILNYKFYLNFKNEGSFGRVEITEPIGFDGCSFVVEQDNKRYGRDAYKINEEINLTFYKGNFENGPIQQIPNGTVINHLSQGFDWLIEVYNEYGFEANIDFEIELDDTVFIPSNLDFQNAETDELTYLTCKAVQEQGRQLIKRRSDVVTDIFSNKDLDGNSVLPAQTQNILLKAKPVSQKSEWLGSPISFRVRNVTSGRNSAYYNNIGNLINSQIDDSLSYIPGFNSPENLVYIKALNDLTNVKIDITIDITLQKYLGNIGTGVLKMQAFIGEDQDIQFDPLGQVIGASTIFQLNIENSSTETINDTINLNNITIQSGKKLFIWFFISMNSTGVFGVEAIINSDSKIEINATSTAIDTVIKGVRYIDVFKENIKRINGFSVDASRFDVGGQYYDQFAFTGNLIKQRDDLPFSVKFKDITEDLSEVNADYQIIDNKIYIGQYSDFYTSKELAAFLSPPDSSFKKVTNERYAINEFEYKYKTYEQDRDESNTTDAIHTETQWLTSNLQVENKKLIDVGSIRDPYKLEATRKLAVKETTSTKDDDKIFLLDVVNLAPNSRGGFTASMIHFVEDGNLKISKDANLPSWALLGFGVNDNFDIDEGINVGNYKVIDIENTIITLEPLPGTTPTESEESLTSVSYAFTNVSFTNRTNQGLVFFDNLINGDDFSNLRYSIKRNIKTWQSYLSTASIDENGVFRNTYFKDNSECTTRFADEPENITEGDNIPNSELLNPVLTPYKYEIRLVVPFDSMSNLLTAIDTVNEDKTISGFVRCVNNKGRILKLYPSKLDYVPSTETLILIGEERFESDNLIIDINKDEIIINEVGYPLDYLQFPFYEFDGDYFKIYDCNQIPVINPTKFDKIIVNGQSFNSSSELLGYLINL